MAGPYIESGRRLWGLAQTQQGLFTVNLGRWTGREKVSFCDDHHRFENDARFEELLRFATVTAGGRLTIQKVICPLSTIRFVDLEADEVT